METLIYILKAHLLFLILGGIYHFILRNEKSFSFNRFYLLTIYGVSIVAPLLDFKLFTKIRFIEPSLFNNTTFNPDIGSSSEAVTSNLITLEALLPWIYGALVTLSIIVFLIKFAKSYIQFKLLYRFARFDFKQKIYWVEDDIPPFTFLNKTLIPNRLKDDKNKNIIIKHEEAHRKTLHFFDIIWVEILSSILIFNPLNKKIKKYIIENHEYLADEYACKVTQKSNYVQLLVKQTLNQKQLQFVSYFAKPTILNRLDMLKSNKNSTSKPILVGFSLLLIATIFACDLTQTEEVRLKQESNSIANIEELDNNNNNIDDERIFTVVEEQANPIGGIEAFYDAIKQDLNGKYPQEAIEKRIEGIVYIQFVIQKDGSLSNIQAVKGIGGGCDELAIQALKNYGDWIPGKQNGKKVNSRRVVPIRFVL